jgi:hypothetical protein
MCYDLNTSVNSSIIGILSSFILYNHHFNQNNKSRKVFKVLALFFSFVTLMQIYDIIFWKSLEKNNGKTNINFVFTKIAMITNHLQPIILAYLINTIIPLNNLSRFTVYVYSVLIFIYSIQIFDKISYTVVTEKSSPSLYWEWNNMDNGYIVYAMFLLTICVLSLELVYPMNMFLLIINLFTFFLSKYTYKVTNIGRFWCNFAAYLPLILLIFEIIYYS